MKTFLRTLLFVVAVSAGLGLGFLWRGSPPTKTAPAATGMNESTGSLTENSPRASQQKNQRPRGDISPLATKLQRDLSMAHGVTNWLYWMDAIERAAPPDFLRLARLAEGNATATRLIASRWVVVNPRHFFDTLVAEYKNGRGHATGGLAEVLLREWPKIDPEGAISALNEAVDLRPKTYWRDEVAARVIQKDPERGLRLFEEWHIGNFSPWMTGVQKWAAVDPRHAAEFTLEVSKGTVAREAMETIGKEWARTDPAGALDFAINKPGELRSTMADAVLKEWAARDRTQAADWLSQADATVRNRLGAAFVEPWAKDDPVAALAWSETNLSGTSLAQAVGRLMNGAAEKDVAKAAALVATMEPSPARSEAAVSVARKWIPDRLAGDTPVAPETIAWLKQLDADSVRRVIEKVEWTWATSDPKSMGAFLATASSEQIPKYAERILVREMARRNPEEALQWVSQLPGERKFTAGREAFGEWRASQPEAAMKWWNELPAGDPRRQPYFEGAVQSMAWDSQGAEQLATLGEAERAAALDVLQTMDLPAERRARLVGLLRRP